MDREVMEYFSGLREPVRGIFTLDRVGAIKKVALELELPVQVLAQSGESYCIKSKTKPTVPVIKQTVPDNYAYISIGTGKEDLGQFWQKVEKLVPIPNKRTV